VISFRFAEPSRTLRAQLGSLPLKVGRSPQCGLVLEQPGVWDDHCELRLANGLVELVPGAKSHTYINGELVQSPTRLRNGDAVTFGGAVGIFEVASPNRRGLRSRELTLWGILALVSLLEILLLIRFR